MCVVDLAGLEERQTSSFRKNENLFSRVGKGGYSDRHLCGRLYSNVIRTVTEGHYYERVAESNY